MSIVLPDEDYHFTLAQWEQFYRANKKAIHQKRTQWLNNRIHIEDDGRQYRIMFRKNRLYLKPYKHVDVKKEQESAQLHALNMVLEKLDEVFKLLMEAGGKAPPPKKPVMEHIALKRR